MVSEQTPIRLKHHRKSIQNQTKKKKKTFTVYFPPPEIQPPHHLQNPFTTSLPKPCQKTISQYPHVSSHQKVTRQPKPFDPATNKPHLSILATIEAPNQLPEKPATTTHKQLKKKKKQPTQAISHQPRPTNQPAAAAAHQPPAADPSATVADTIFAPAHLR